MTMKKMKNFMALLLALVMTMSLVACGNKTSEGTKTGEEIGCYVQTTETGEKVLVDKDGKAVTDFTLDAEGNVLDADGNVVVKAEDITAYVEQSGNVADEKAEEPKVDDAQKTEDKTDAKDEVKADDKKTETKVDESKKDEKKPADNKQDTSKTDTKTDTKTDNKSDNKSDTKNDTKTETPSQKPSTPSYDNGSLTTAQVKELQRWYGVTADGQWGAGSKKAAGGRTADEAWAYYQSNKQITTPETPSGGNTGNTGSTGNTGNTGNTGSTGGGSTTPITPPEPAKPTKANIDREKAMRVGNEYAISIGFTDNWDGASSYFPPIFLERDCPESCWNQEWVESTIKQAVDYVKERVEAAGRWHPEDPRYVMSVNCVVNWNASAGYHEIYVYYAA